MGKKFATKKIIEILRENNNISVGEFMNIALYDQRCGYYMTKMPFGKSGDFVTSPEISQLFGECIAIFIVNLWMKNIQQKEFEIIEIGAGSGYLMFDIIRIIKQFPKCYQKCTVKIIEKSQFLIKKQKIKLKQYQDKISWQKNFPNTKKAKIFIANEFFDALAIEQYQKQNGEIKQICIKIDQFDNLIMDKRNLKQNQVPQYVLGKLANLDENDETIVEYSFIAKEYLTKICYSLKKASGFALIIDYGYTEKNACGDTLQAVSKNKYSKINENIGKSDLSAHVDFNLLCQIAKKNSIFYQNVMPQAEFLLNMGIEAIVAKHSINATEKQKENLIQQKKRLVEQKDIISMGNLFKILLLHDKEKSAPYPFNRSTQGF